MKTELITIDDNAIKFEVVKEGGKVKIENKIKVNNISDEKIVLGIKIDHREFYVVTPSHCFIEPHEIKEISIYFKHSNVSELNENGVLNHKFKFEAYTINDIKETDPKTFFESIKTLITPKTKKYHIKIPVIIILKDSPVNSNDINVASSIMSIRSSYSIQSKQLSSLRSELSSLQVTNNDLSFKLSSLKRQSNHTLSTAKLPSSYLTNDDSRIIPFNVLLLLCFFSFIGGIILTY